MKRIFLFLSIALITLSGCATIKHTAKYDVTEGVYYSSILRLNSSKRFVAENKNKDTITIVPVTNKGTFDSLRKSALPSLSNINLQSQLLFKPSLDLDVITIPFKYRPAIGGFPRQLNTSYNIALYLGWRTDAYAVKYKADYFGGYNRRIDHFGFSLGVFGGIGATTVNPWVTKNQIDIEYDGFIWTTGVSIVFAVNNLSAGIGLGLDHLTDQNKHYWIYQRKPWIGLTLGLNLN